MTEVIVYIALGANLGDRASTLRSACAMLDAEPDVTVTRQSSVHETEPVGPPDQRPYLNAVVEARTTLSARALMETCLRIEAAHGRDRRAGERWGPRTLDLDVLFFGDQIINEPNLHIPHPRLHERLFVLEPLAELAAGLRHPIRGESIECLLEQQRQRSRIAGID